jgi:uncharacterized repeat protein (TIGR01451 family)
MNSGREGTTMRPSTTAAQRVRCGEQNASARIWLCLVLLLAFAATLNAQTPVNPTTNTILFSGQANQDPQDHNTNPLAGIVMQGTAISQITGRPVRHLWVADTFASICRMDPEIDAAGPWHMNMNSCYFFVNSGGAAIPVGGQFAYDPGRKFLYFADNNGASQGVIRIGFDPSGDTGEGAVDASTAFTLGGGAAGRKATFLGGTGCPLPTTGTQPNGAALSPLGDLYVGFLDSGDILRFNSPATATETGFGTCAQFVQKVAVSPDGALTNGLAWIGHDLWAGDGNSPFFIPNADTTCLVPPRDVCTTANGTVTATLAAVGATAALEGDQVYPNTNGNNLYFGVGSQIAWIGNVAGGAANQTFTLTYINDPAPDPPLAAVSGLAVDGTDPANLVVYSAEDPAVAVVPPLLGQARWWQTTQTSAAPDVPGTPLDVVAVAGNSQITLSWSPAQVAQPVTSYTVRNSFISLGAPLADITVNPAPGQAFPPTSIVIPGLINGVQYAFEVSASNGNGSSAFSVQSNIAQPPGFGVPSAPTGATAVAGDTQAVVSWTVSSSNGGSPITSYTVTVIAAGVPTGVTVTVPPPAFGSNTGSTLIGGLTNGTSYTFTVHATNIAGDSAESAQSNAIIPSAANLPVVSVSMSGPTSVTATPAQLTYTLTVTNPSSFPVSNISVVNNLSTVPASISTVSRSASGVVTVTTSSPTSFAINQQVVIAGVSDASFNGTFTITDTPTTTTFTYAQAGAVASSASGTATLLPLAYIVSATTAQASCSAGGPGVASFTCAVGNMDPGAVVRIPFIVQMQNQTITNSATVSGTDAAGTPLVNQTASVTTAAPAPPPPNNGVITDLQVGGSAVKGSAPLNTADTYNFQVKDNKPVAAPNVVFTDTLPSTLAFSSASTTLGVCTGPAVGTLGGKVTCNIPSLGGAGAPNQFTVTINVVVKAKGTILNTGSVTFDGSDTNPANNSSTVKITGQ